MENPPAIETVYEALQCLYHGPNSAGKEEASDWLGRLQKSVYGWKIADELLHRKNNVESCYFAAQTMRAKVQSSFHELPTSSHNSLKDSLINHLQCVTEQTYPAIITQLSLALADLALQSNEWSDPINELLNKLGENHMLPLLDVLTVLPEEVSSNSLRLGLNRREKMLDYLSDNSQSVFVLLNNCSIRGDLALELRLVKCMGSWLTLSKVNTEPLTRMQILQWVFSLLTSQQTTGRIHEAAADCLCNALYLIEEIQQHLALANILCVNILNMKEAYLMSVATEDSERSQNFSRLFTELAESLLPSLIKSVECRAYLMQVMDILLDCVSHPEYEVAQVTFTFWYRLSEDLYQLTNEMYKSDGNDVLTQTFKPYIQRLIIALQKQVEMEPDAASLLNEADEFWEFRQHVCELIKDVAFIPSSMDCLHSMYSLLFSCEAPSWEKTEACLFVLQSVARNIMPEENVMLPKVACAVLQLEETSHIQLRYTAVQLISELSEWINKHAEMLETVLNFLLRALKQPLLATVSAIALQSMCLHCSQHMSPHLTGLIHIVECFDTLNISNEAAIGILKGTATVFEHLPPNDIQSALKRLCVLQLSPLSELLKNSPEVKKGGREDPALWLDRLAAIFRHTSIPVQNGDVHPCQPIFTEVVWQVVAGICEHYQKDSRIVERYCRCIRFAIRSMGKHATPILHPLVQQMITVYSLHGHSSFLYLGSILVDEFGKDVAYVECLINMLMAFLPPTLSLLRQNNGLTNHPDTVDDLFRLAHRFVQRAPVEFLRCEGAGLIMDISLEACLMEHKDAHAAVLKFLTVLAEVAQRREKNPEAAEFALKILNKTGQDLVCKLLNSVAMALPNVLIVDIADFFCEMIVLDVQMMGTWMEAAIRGLPHHGVGGGEAATPQQLQHFYKTVLTARTSSSITASLKELSRLYR